MAEQIKISYLKIESAEKKMSILSKKIKSRRLNLKFKNSKGGMVDSMTETANQLNDVKNALCSLIDHTKKVTNNARNSFGYMDIRLARQIEGQKVFSEEKV